MHNDLLSAELSIQFNCLSSVCDVDIDEISEKYWQRPRKIKRKMVNDTSGGKVLVEYDEESDDSDGEDVDFLHLEYEDDSTDDDFIDKEDIDEEDKIIKVKHVSEGGKTFKIRFKRARLDE
jgi:hypothetical protein